MNMTRAKSFIGLLALSWGTLAVAQEKSASSPRDEEIALAISAAPPAVASKAGVYVLDKGGYVEARKSQNGFVCIVEHRIVKAVEPQCLDAEGVKTFLPRILMVGEMRAHGKPEIEIRDAVKKGFADGRFKAPKRPGIDYMLSTKNVVTIDEEKGIAVPFPPHLMFYAPGMTNADVGSDGTPGSSVFVVDEKSPHALMIVPVPTGGAGAGHSHSAH
jgi:hypothetical protein